MGPLLALLLLNTFLSVHTYLSQFKLREDLQELREDVEDLQELGGGVERLKKLHPEGWNLIDAIKKKLKSDDED